MSNRFEHFGTVGKQTVAKMEAHIAAGKKVIIASRDMVRVGTVFRMPKGFNFNVRVVAVATRKEYLEQAPAEQRPFAEEMARGSSFYLAIVPTTAPVSEPRTVHCIEVPAAAIAQAAGK